MPSPKPPDPTAVQYALECTAKGMSPAAIAAEMTGLDFPVGPDTIRRWLKRYGGGRPLPPPPEDRPKPKRPKPILGPPPVVGVAAALAARRAEPVPEPEPDLGTGESTAATLDVLRKHLQATLREVQVNRVHNPKLAQQLGRDAAQLANTVARLEKGTAEDADVVRMSREDIETAAQAIRERLQKYADRPLLCAHCSRELSVAWGEAPELLEPDPRSGVEGG